MQMLVYENYNKFISATETIKRMKNNVDAMDGDMEAVRLVSWSAVASAKRWLHNEWVGHESVIGTLDSSAPEYEVLSLYVEATWRKRIHCHDIWRLITEIAEHLTIHSSFLLKRVKMERISKTAHSIDETMAENRSKVSRLEVTIISKICHLNRAIFVQF